jgi:hypothetical protein
MTPFDDKNLIDRLQSGIAVATVLATSGSGPVPARAA